MMKRAIYTVAFLFFLGAWTGLSGDTQAPPTADAPTALSLQQQQEWVDEHNYWRSKVGAPNLRWSSSLATYAQAWADDLEAIGCNMVHRDQTTYGENLKRAAPRWSSSGQRTQQVSAKQVVDAWASEIRWYRYGTNSCQSGQACGHYTQVVWANTQEVGCAQAVCDDQSQVWVCNYSPRGNIDGQKPY